MSQQPTSKESAPTNDYVKWAGDIKSQIVHLTAMLLDLPHDNNAYTRLATARSALEEAYACLRASIVPPSRYP